MANRRRSGKKIDFLHWAYASAATGGHAAGTIAAMVFAAQHLPETLMRLRGEVLISLDALGVVGSSANIGVGLIYVPEGTGTTVLWSPITDGDAPWVWVDYHTIAYEEPVVDVISNPISQTYRGVIDNKAMRIVKNSELQCVWENVTVQGVLSVNSQVQVRALSGT